jgi:hypothetical protein
MSKVTQIKQPELQLCPATGKMFMALDKAGHSLTYGFVARGWMLENPKQGLIRVLPNLIRGLSELERVSGTPADRFVVTENPYA